LLQFIYLICRNPKFSNRTIIDHISEGDFLKKPVDLNSLVSSYKSLSEDTFKEFLRLFNFTIRDDEIEQLSAFINNLHVEDKFLGYFYVGYIQFNFVQKRLIFSSKIN